MQKDTFPLLLFNARDIVTIPIPHMVPGAVHLTNTKMDKDDILSVATKTNKVKGLIHPTFPSVMTKEFIQGSRLHHQKHRKTLKRGLMRDIKRYTKRERQGVESQKREQGKGFSLQALFLKDFQKWLVVQTTPKRELMMPSNVQQSHLLRILPNYQIWKLLRLMDILM